MRREEPCRRGRRLAYIHIHQAGGGGDIRPSVIYKHSVPCFLSASLASYLAHLEVSMKGRNGTTKRIQGHHGESRPRHLSTHQNGKPQQARTHTRNIRTHATTKFPSFPSFLVHEHPPNATGATSWPKSFLLSGYQIKLFRRSRGSCGSWPVVARRNGLARPSPPINKMQAMK